MIMAQQGAGAIMSLPIFRAAGATYAFVFGNIPNLLRVLWLPALLVGAVFAWIFRDLFPIFQMHIPLGGSEEDALELMQRLAPLLRWGNVIQIGIFLVGVIASAGLLKPILRGEWTKWPFYFQLGLDEGRLVLALFIAYVVQLLFIAVSVVIAVIAVGLIAVVVPSKETFPLSFLIAFVACWIANIWMDLRLSLVAPTSIATRTIGFEAAWNLTRGQVWHLLGFWILVLGPVFVLIQLALVVGAFIALLPVRNVHFPHPLEVPAYLHGLSLPAALGIGLGLTGISFVLRTVGSGIVYRLRTEQSPA
jgi:hypothetical protein